jgi:hypothetical protein
VFKACQFSEWLTIHWEAEMDAGNFGVQLARMGVFRAQI